VSAAELPGVGFVLGSGFAPARLPEIARLVEDEGFTSIWATEDYFLTGGIAGAATVLGATSRVLVGTGILSAYARHPALTAMEAATLAGAYPGRFRLGLGAGSAGWLDQQGIAHSRPLATVRGHVEATRRLLAGEEVTGTFGAAVLDRVRLAYPPVQPPPILIGATGPRMTALTGEIADGLVLSVFSSPEFVLGQRALLIKSGYGRPAHVTTFAFLAVDRSPARARARVRQVLAEFLAESESSVMTDVLGITAELRAIVADGGAAALAADMPDDWVDRLAVCGDPDTCAARIRALLQAGSDEVALAPVDVASLPHDVPALGAALRAG
jgi:alkanesulfonate monooxygenase SsuD/methylene tetrahydromethanopterin reductase-like flavin-dependent oxidoreductase (luciferase family)